MHKQQILLHSNDRNIEPGNLGLTNSEAADTPQSLVDQMMEIYVVAAAEGHTDVINAQPEKQYAADAIREGTTACNVVLKWCTVLPQRLAWTQHS